MKHLKTLSFILLLLFQCNLQANLQFLPANSVYYKDIHDAGESRTVQNRLQEKISVRDFGAKGDGISDDTMAFTKAFNAGLHIIIPPGTYQVHDLLPVRGQTIDAYGAVIMGISDDDSIFMTSKGIFDVTIRGGEWAHAKYVWEHVGKSAAGRLLFEGMKIHDVEAGFRFSSVIHTTWENCSFGVVGGPIKQDGNIQYGIWFDGSGAGQTNHNRVVNSSFERFKLAGIYMGDSKIPKTSNYFLGNRFELAFGPGIHFQGINRSVEIANNYFERVGGDGWPDILFNPVGPLQNYQILIRANTFATPCGKVDIGKGCNVKVSERISVNGNSAITVLDNYASLFDNMVFVRINTLKVVAHRLERNFLMKGGSQGNYKDFLFSQVGDSAIDWSTYVPGGNLSGDEVLQQTFSGKLLFTVRMLPDNETIPSVRTGHLYRTKGNVTITNFADGLEGQTIKILATDVITIENNANIHLSGNQSYKMNEGDTLTLTMYQDGIWTEDARNKK